MPKSRQDVVFFNDYGLWATMELEAVSRKVSVPQFIMQVIGHDNGIPNEVRNTKVLYNLCKQQANKCNIGVAQYIERCCKEAIEGKDRKWWELPKSG